MRITLKGRMLPIIIGLIIFILGLILFLVNTYILPQNPGSYLSYQKMMIFGLILLFLGVALSIILLICERKNNKINLKRRKYSTELSPNICKEILMKEPYLYFDGVFQSAMLENKNELIKISIHSRGLARSNGVIYNFIMHFEEDIYYKKACVELRNPFIKNLIIVFIIVATLILIYSQIFYPGVIDWRRFAGPISIFMILLILISYAEKKIWTFLEESVLKKINLQKDD